MQLRTAEADSVQSMSGPLEMDFLVCITTSFVVLFIVREANDNCNFDGFVNSRYTIGVGAVDVDGKQAYYSEPCSAMLVCASSSGVKYKLILTTVSVLILS